MKISQVNNSQGCDKNQSPNFGAFRIGHSSSSNLARQALHNKFSCLYDVTLNEIVTVDVLCTPAEKSYLDRLKTPRQYVAFKEFLHANAVNAEAIFNDLVIKSQKELEKLYSTSEAHFRQFTIGHKAKIEEEIAMLKGDVIQVG